MPEDPQIAMDLSKYLPRRRIYFGKDAFKLHDLRHTIGMRLREAGVKEQTIADILRHNRRGMTAHYSMAQIVESEMLWNRSPTSEAVSKNRFDAR